jgi:Holliday junction resolvase-like predicted endonuclease
MPSELKRKSDRAARVYLEMRGFKVLEQNWGLSRNKIDLIASKDKTVYFIEIKIHDNFQKDLKLDINTSSKLNKIRQAGESWMDDSKWPGKYVFSTLELAEESLTVISFNDSLV